jgi:hypothetical protein
MNPETFTPASFRLNNRSSTHRRFEPFIIPHPLFRLSEADPFRGLEKFRSRIEACSFWMNFLNFRARVWIPSVNLSKTG